MPDHAILLIDNNPNLLRAADFVLRELGRVRTVSVAGDLTRALGERMYAVILTTIALPDCDSEQLHAMLRQLQPRSARLLMVAKEAGRVVSLAVNAAAPRQLLLKPFTAQTLRHAVADALASFEHAESERSAVEATLNATVEAMSGVLAVVQPAAFGRAVRIRRIAKMLSERMGLGFSWDLDVAAVLSQVGLLPLPSELAERITRSQPIAESEREQFLAATEAAWHPLESIPRMKRVLELLRSVDLVATHNRTTAPHGDLERVLTLALDFDGAFSEYGSAVEALRVLESRIARYHAPFFDVLRTVVGAPNDVLRIDVPLADVRLGQVFAADVRSPSGLLLIARGQTVTLLLVRRIRDDWHAFALTTMVRMLDPNQAGGARDTSETEETNRAA